MGRWKPRAVRRTKGDLPQIPETGDPIFDSMREVFEKRYGRPPRHGDPFLFDPRCDVPTALSAEELPIFEVYRHVYMGDALVLSAQDERTLLAEVFGRFREHFGRFPEENEPFIFDPAFDTPTEFTNDDDQFHHVTEMAFFAGIQPDYIHAARVSGVFITERNLANILWRNVRCVQEWVDAVLDHRKLFPRTRTG